MATTTLDTAIYLWSAAIGIDYLKLFFGLTIVFIIVIIFVDRFSKGR